MAEGNGLLNRHTLHGVSRVRIPPAPPVFGYATQSLGFLGFSRCLASSSGTESWYRKGFSLANYVVPYLTRRGNVFWFRMAVPENLVHRVGRREIKFSLRSSHPSVARMRCRILTVEILQLMALGPATPALTRDAITRIARRCFSVAMEQVDDLTAFFVPNDPKLDPSIEAAMALEERQNAARQSRWESRDNQDENAPLLG